MGDACKSFISYRTLLTYPAYSEGAQTINHWLQYRKIFQIRENPVQRARSKKKKAPATPVAIEMADGNLEANDDDDEVTQTKLW